LELAVYERSLDDAAWEAGWRSLCSPGEGAATVSVPASKRALEFSALASIDRGDYATAWSLLQRLVDEGLAGEVPNALAYRAALDLDWGAAVRAYEPQSTPRHDRWWGTVFYLAAQQQMFDGALDEAEALYRRADAAYGVRGPYLGLGLVECLIQQGRPLEAWDAYRRALVVMPVDEALVHLSIFNELRQEALRTWHQLQLDDRQVSNWLAFYEEESQREWDGAVALDGEPTLQVPLELDLGKDRTLLGFDYRVEDVETGPFMTVDFYVREGQGEQTELWRMRRTVLNQAPNGAFAWDAAPDGVRPVGWHGLVYSHELAALYTEEIVPGQRWLCLDAGRIGTSFGLQSNTVPLVGEQASYIQGGKVFPVGDAALSLGRTWFGVNDPHNYSNVGGGRLPDQVQFMVGTWEPVAEANSAAVWLMAHQTSKGCFREVYLFSLHELHEVPRVR
jgi:tetratricopeptide (TPR) repeat protein